MLKVLIKRMLVCSLCLYPRHRRGSSGQRNSILSFGHSGCSREKSQQPTPCSRICEYRVLSYEASHAGQCWGEAVSFLSFMSCRPAGVNQDVEGIDIFSHALSFC